MYSFTFSCEMNKDLLCNKGSNTIVSLTKKTHDGNVYMNIQIKTQFHTRRRIPVTSQSAAQDVRIIIANPDIIKKKNP